MAKQYKKLQQKIHPKAKKEVKDEKPVGKDYLLMGIFAFTLIVTIVAWDNLEPLNRAMYILLTLSLGLTYAVRHAQIKDDYKKYLSAASTGAIGMAVALFLINLYYTFVG